MTYKKKKQYYPIQNKPNNNVVPYKNEKYSPFSGNLSNDFKHYGKNKDISGFVERELIIEDANGNRKIARERQFFNAIGKIGRIEIK